MSAFVGLIEVTCCVVWVGLLFVTIRESVRGFYAN